MKSSKKLWKLSMASAMVTGSIVAMAPGVAEAATGFTDVPEASTPYDAVMSLTSRNVIDGYTDGTYRPGEEVSRGQAAKLIVGILNIDTENVQDPKFTDVPTSHPFHKYIAALANENIISGYTDGRFGVNEGLKRSQMAKILTGAYNFDEKPLANNQFTDVNKDAYYAPYLQALIDNEITFGKTETLFAPDELVNRGQMAIFLYRSDLAKFGTSVNAKVTNVEEGTIYTSKGNYEVTETLKTFFSEENAKALKDSNIVFRLENGKVSAVEQLELNTSGTSSDVVVFDGGTAAIKGDLIVQGDYLHIKSLTVEGTTFVSDKSKVSAASNYANIAAVTESSIIFTDTKLSTVYVSKDSGVTVEVRGDSSVTGFNISSNVNLIADEGISIPQLTIHEGANHITIDAPVDNLTVNTPGKLTIDGSGSIENATVQSAADVKFETEGKIDKIDIKSKDAKVGLGLDTRVGNIVVPEGTEAQDVVQDYDNVKENIENIDGEENPELKPETPPATGGGGGGAVSNPALANVKSLGEFKDALADPKKTTINITADFETEEKIVVNRPVTINGGGKQITFTGDEEGWNSNYVIQVYNTTDVVISNIKVTGGDAALLVNGSEVTLKGNIDVSGNEFGGIEVGKGDGELNEPKLNVTEAKFKNNSEEYGQPTIWEDEVTGTVTGFAGEKITKDEQPQYYLTVENAAKVSVSSLEEFESALDNEAISTINLTADIENVGKRLVIDRAITINGGKHTISYTEAINSLPKGSKHGIAVLANDVVINDLKVELSVPKDADWLGVYALQVYKATGVTLNNYEGTGADAALLVNGSKVELIGTTTVTGNKFGGIEVSKGTSTDLDSSKLTVTGNLVNESEAYGQPTIWLVKGQGEVEGNVPSLKEDEIKNDQMQYYLDENALFTQNVLNFTQLKEAVENPKVTNINITSDINVTEKVNILFEKNINGNGHSLSGNKNIDDAWSGFYILQFYNTTGSVKDISIKGGDAAIYVNGSTVTLNGDIDVSGNGFGGIEVSQGENVTEEAKLDISDATLINTTEADARPTIWEDQIGDQDEPGKVTGFGTMKIDYEQKTVNNIQRFYYIKDSFSAPTPVSQDSLGD